jgi:hypothetical protein
VRIAIAILLLGLPLLALYGAVVNRRSRGLFIAAGLLLVLANPLANVALFAPIDRALQSRMYDKARAAALLGMDESRVRELLGKPWRERVYDGRFKQWAYVPCRICVRSYSDPFFVYFENGKVIGFRSRERLDAIRDTP